MIPLNTIYSTIKKKFVKDTAWTLIGAFSMGASGVLMNIIVTKGYGAEGLGLFTISLGIYLLLYHCANCGLRHSVSKHIAEYAEEETIRKRIFGSALVGTIIISTMVASLAFLLTPLFAGMFNSDQVSTLLIPLLFALPILSLNKVILGYLNGSRRMKFYSLMNALRFNALIVLGILGVYYQVPLTEYMLIVPLAEGLTLITSIAFLKLHQCSSLLEFTPWLKRHLKFGIHSFSSDLYAEIGVRIDTLLLGMLLNPVAVGIYAFAANLVKGLMQLAQIIQVNFNPIIANLWASGRLEELQSRIRRVRKATYLLHLPVTICTLIAYPLLVSHYFPDISSTDNHAVFFILFFGVISTSGYYSLMALMSCTGYVRYEARITFFSMVASAIGNLVLIPIFGVIGAALSTSASLIVSVLLLNYYARKQLGIHLFRLGTAHQ